MKKSTFTKSLMVLAILFIAFTTNAQCNASFTSALGPAGSASFNSTSTGTVNPCIYWWNFGDGNTGAGASPVHTYSVNGNYQVYLTISSGSPACNDSASAVVVITNTTGIPCTPTVSFSMQKDSLALPAIVWNGVPNYPLNIVAANWQWGDGSNTTGLYPSHTYAVAGFYTVCVTITVSCGGGATAQACSVQNIWKSAAGGSNAMAVLHIVNQFPTGIKNLNHENVAFTIYPNPNNGEFNIEMQSDMSAKFLEVSVVNLMGELVYTLKEDTQSNSISKKLNLNNLANGTYFVKTNTGNSITTKKLVINK